MATAPAITAEFAAGFRDVIVQAISEELKTTRNIVAAIPDAKRDYTPAEKSRNAWDLAWHIIMEDVLFLDLICEGNFDFTDARYRNQEPKTIADMVDWYERNMKRALDKVRELTPQQLAEPLDFMGMVTLPRCMYLNLMNSHSIHHRGQLSAYLRPMGVRVPSIYGPSADSEEQATASAAD